MKLEDIDTVEHKVPDQNPPVRSMPSTEAIKKSEEASDSEEGSIIIDGKRFREI